MATIICRCTSPWHSPSRDYKHPKLDTGDFHYYMRPAEKEMFRDLTDEERVRFVKLFGL